MAEIEHFCDPDQMGHAGFKSVENLQLPLYTKEAQMSGGHIVKMTLGEALKSGTIANETLGLDQS